MLGAVGGCTTRQMHPSLGQREPRVVFTTVRCRRHSSESVQRNEEMR